MTRLLFGALLVAGCAHTSGSGGSAQCDEIHHLANEWHELANYIHGHNDNGLDADEVHHVSTEEHRLMPATHTLIDAAANTGGSYGQMAKNMEEVLKELDAIDDDEDWTEDVKVIDKLVGEVDHVTTECDHQSS